MSFGISGSKSKQKSSTDSNLTSTTTPNVPDWLLDPAKASAANITKLGATDPSTLVLGEDPLQAQARVRAGGLTGSPWNFDAAADLTRGIAGQSAKKVEAASLLDNLDSYTSPYRKDVVDATAADFDANAGRTRAQQDLAIAGEGAFGGSGAALTKSATEGELARGRATTMATLLDQMFNTGAGLSNMDAGRRQAASSENASLAMQQRAQTLDAARQLADLSAGFDATQRANIATQAAAGATARDIATEQVQAPFNLQDWINQALAGLNGEMFTGKTTNEVGSSKSTGSGSTIGASASASYGGK